MHRNFVPPMLFLPLDGNFSISDKYYRSSNTLWVARWPCYVCKNIWPLEGRYRVQNRDDCGLSTNKYRAILSIDFNFDSDAYKQRDICEKQQTADGQAISFDIFFVPLILFRPLDGATTFPKIFVRKRALFTSFVLICTCQCFCHLLDKQRYDER